MKGGGLSILALFLRSYFVPFPFTYRILLSHEIDGVRKEKERLTASMSRLFSLHTRSSYSHLLPSSLTRRLSSARGSFTRASLTPTRRLRRLVQRRVESDGGPWE